MKMTISFSFSLRFTSSISHLKSSSRLAVIIALCLVLIQYSSGEATMHHQSPQFELESQSSTQTNQTARVVLLALSALAMYKLHRDIPVFDFVNWVLRERRRSNTSSSKLDPFSYYHGFFSGCIFTFMFCLITNQTARVVLLALSALAMYILDQDIPVFDFVNWVLREQSNPSSSKLHPFSYYYGFFSGCIFTFMFCLITNRYNS